MPTKPLQTVLYREFARLQIKEILNTITPLLQELVNNGTNVLIRCATTAKGIDYKDLAPLSLYRHILELTDAFEVLIAESCAAPTIPILRSSFEALMSLDFILETDQHFVLRSLAWYAQDIRSRIELIENWLPDTGRGSEFQKSLRADKNLHDVELLQQEVLKENDEIKKTLDGYVALLSSHEFSPIETEFSKLRKQRRKSDWYCLFGGPSNLRNLAYHLKRSAQYDFLYRRWSGIAHANDASPFITKTSDGKPGIRGIRSPNPVVEVSMFAALFILDATKIMIQKLRPGESFEKYYFTEIRDNWLKLISIPAAIRKQYAD